MPLTGFRLVLLGRDEETNTHRGFEILDPDLVEAARELVSEEPPGRVFSGGLMGITEPITAEEVRALVAP